MFHKQFNFIVAVKNRFEKIMFMILIFVWKSITTISFTNYKILQPQFGFMSIGTFSIGRLKIQGTDNHKEIITASHNFT